MEKEYLKLAPILPVDLWLTGSEDVRAVEKADHIRPFLWFDQGGLGQ